MPEKFLPLGSVVMLRGGQKKVMITGYCMIDSTNINNMYDYSGCLYPEGIVSSDSTPLFNHSQIEKIYFLGYLSTEFKEFNSKLVQYFENQKKENKKEEDISKIPPIGPGLNGDFLGTNEQ